MSGRNRTRPILWSRRRTLVSALALAAVVAASPGLDAGGRGLLARAPGALALWRNRAAARAIGRRYLAAEPGEADAVFLAEQLFGDDRTSLSLAEMRQAVGAARTRDFANGDTVLIDGWLLARSEVRLCALSVLS